MDLIALLLSCSLYPDDDLVRAVAQSNSRANPYFVADVGIEPTALDPPEPHALAEALARVNEITAKGGRPVLGLMQLPPRWIASFGRSNRDAFDPCTNMAIGTAMLSQFDYECGVANSPPPAGRPKHADRRACVLERYADAVEVPEFLTIARLELRFQRPIALAEHVLGTPILFADAFGGASARRILVPLEIVAGGSGEKEPRVARGPGP